MLPLTTWTYEELCGRLDILEKHELYAELVIVCNQLIEQIVKRYLAYYIQDQRKYWNNKEKKWIVLYKTSDRDEIIRSATEPVKWQVLWNKTISDIAGLPTISKAFDDVAGPNSWSILITKEKFQTSLERNKDSNTSSIKYGFRQCRHILVHGMQSPPKAELDFHAKWGIKVIKQILQPDTGWPSLLGWNPQHRLPPFRSRKH